MIASLLSALLLVAPVQSPPSAELQYGTVVVQSDPSPVAVAVTLRFPAGSAQDEQGKEGTAHLLAQVMEAEANRQLARSPSRVSVGVTRDEFLVSLVTAPGEWQAGLSAVQDLLDGAPLPGAELEAARARQLARLTFEEGAPVRSFELERVRLVRGPQSPAGRPVGGTGSSVETIDLGDLDDFRTRHLDPASATAAVVGPVSRNDVERVLPGEIRTASARSPFQQAGEGQRPTARRAGADTLAAPAEPRPAPPRTRLQRDLLSPLGVPSSPEGPPAWSEGDRREVDREITSVWFAVAWPFPQGTSRSLLEFLALTLQEGLVSSPPDPGLYGADVRVEVLEGRPVLTVSISADPREAARWEERTLAAMESIVEAPPEGSFFELSRRRFRNQVLLDMSGPLERSRWLARIVAEEDEIPDPQADVWRLSRDGLSQAAAAAGPPRIFVLGPLHMMRTGR